MNASDLQSLVSTVDELIFSHRGEHLDDLEQAILEGAFDNQKYAEIAKNNHRSEKYVKDLAGKLWQTISAALGEEVSKSTTPPQADGVWIRFCSQTCGLHCKVINLAASGGEFNPYNLLTKD